MSELLLIPTKLEQILDNRADIQYFASLYFNHPSIFFIGRNIDYAIGMEGSLSHFSPGYGMVNFKHIDDGIPQKFQILF